MTSTFRPEDLVGRTAYDNDGDKIGKIDQIFLDDHTGQPTWVSVNTGLFGSSETFIPLQGASVEGDGDVRVAYDNDKVKNAPRIDEDHHLSPEEERELHAYYDMGDDYDTYTREHADHDHHHGGERHGSDHDREGGVVRHEEELRVGKEKVETGKVRLRKYTTTEKHREEVPVEREQVRVERETIHDGERRSGGLDDTGEHTESVTLHEERAVAGKETVAKERINLDKETVRDTEVVEGEVRKEHVDVEDDTNRH